jgi:plasmid stabilization system protein ParE
MAFRLIWTPSARLDLKEIMRAVEIMRVWHAARESPDISVELGEIENGDDS